MEKICNNFKLEMFGLIFIPHFKKNGWNYLLNVPLEKTNTHFFFLKKTPKKTALVTFSISDQFILVKRDGLKDMGTEGTVLIICLREKHKQQKK